VFHDKSTTQNLKQIWSTGFRNKQKLNTWGLLLSNEDKRFIPCLREFTLENLYLWVIFLSVWSMYESLMKLCKLLASFVT
jgi:hypothetical protein